MWCSLFLAVCTFVCDHMRSLCLCVCMCVCVCVTVWVNVFFCVWSLPQAVFTCLHVSTYVYVHMYVCVVYTDMIT